MSFSLESVKELREKTGAGMMDCKKALQDSDGDMESAVDFLRKKGLATAAKKSSRAAAEGIIADLANTDGSVNVLVDVNCETDFVTKTEDFQNYAKDLAKLVLEKNPADLDALLALELHGKAVNDYQTDIVAKIGENIGVRRFEVVKTSGTEKAAKYMHMGSKIGTIVVYDDPNGKLDDELATGIAMHIAAMSPLYVSKSEVSEDYINKEKDIFREQMASEGKPENIIEKIIEGKLQKQLSEVCLEDQIFVKDLEGKTTIKNNLKNVDPSIKIKKFVRLQVGEGVEKKKADLADEVAEMIK